MPKRVRWLLEELGVPYKLHRLDLSKGEHKTAEYLKVHPHGVVPAIIDHENKVNMFESVAIVIYLAEKYNRLQPAPNTADRAHYLQWCVYVVGTLEEQLLKVYLNGPASSLPAEKRNAEHHAEGMKRLEECGKVASLFLPLLSNFHIFVRCSVLLLKGRSS